MTATTEAKTLASHLERRLPTYLEELRVLCAFECPTVSKSGVDMVGAWVKSRARARGWKLRSWPDELVGNSLVATVQGGTKHGPAIMLVAHLDTVYPVGIATARPMRIEGDRLRGPGTCDNKSGLLSGLHAVEVLQDRGMLEPFRSISVVCGADEETDMRSSGALLRELAPNFDLALVLEAGRENGDIVGARKGAGQFTLETHGKSAHAGVEPHRGANAILALAQQTVALQLLNGMRPGVTVNVGTVRGGTLSNVVPDLARAEVDVRVAWPEDMTPVGDAIEAIAGTPYVAGVTGTLHGGWRIPPMARTPEIVKLADLANDCAHELGFEVAAASTGGVSYANVLATLGLPVLDGLGPVGGLDHSPDEYILASSIVPRTSLLALMMLRRAQLTAWNQ
jgi:glutamate carboxypeptidase